MKQWYAGLCTVAAVGYKLKVVAVVVEVAVAVAVAEVVVVEWKSIDVLPHRGSHQCFHRSECYSNSTVSIEDMFLVGIFDSVTRNIAPLLLRHW